MSNNDDEVAQEIGRGLGKVLNLHGYGFQYSALRNSDALYTQGLSPWAFQVAEFPVEVKGYGTRIDFILEKSRAAEYLVVECKRANPRVLNWCFVQAPFVRRNQQGGEVWVEEVRVDERGGDHAGVHALTYAGEVYHIGLELKSLEKGDSIRSGRGAIEEAATQVSRGLNGMVEFLARHPEVLGDRRRLRIIPAIFTTARIWTSTIDLGSADRITGDLSVDDLESNEKAWLWYRYHLSPGIKHTIPADEVRGELGDLLDLRYARTIAVVGAAGIENFLAQGW